MSLASLELAFRDVSKPTEVRGDLYGVDATAQQIQRLLDAKPYTLSADDFSGYVGYYLTTGGEDDFRYLLPKMLRIWREELAGESWFPHYLHAHLAATDFIEGHLAADQRDAVVSFMRDALYERISHERLLRIEGKSDTHLWFERFASFGVIAADMRALWQLVWAAPTIGHARAVAQYASCLICSDSTNPIFAPWNCNQGGGPPRLWGFDSVGFDERWQEPNVEFLREILTADYLGQRLSAALKQLSEPTERQTVELLLRELDRQHKRTVARCQMLPEMLSCTPDCLMDWKSLGLD